MIFIQRTPPIYVDLSSIDLQFKLALDLRFHGSHPFLVSRFRSFFPAWRFELAQEKYTMWSGGHLLDVTEERTSVGEELDEIIVWDFLVHMPSAWIPALGPCVYPALFHPYTSARFGDSCQGGVLLLFSDQVLCALHHPAFLSNPRVLFPSLLYISLSLTEWIFTLLRPLAFHHISLYHSRVLWIIVYHQSINYQILDHHHSLLASNGLLFIIDVTFFILSIISC